MCFPLFSCLSAAGQGLSWRLSVRKCVGDMDRYGGSDYFERLHAFAYDE